MTAPSDATLRALCEAASAPPWPRASSEMYEDTEPTCIYRALGPPCGTEGDPDGCDDAARQADADAAFLAAAREALPALLDRVAAAERHAADATAAAQAANNMAAAAEAKLAVAVAALREIESNWPEDPRHVAREALAAVEERGT